MRTGRREGPFDRERAEWGLNGLIRSLLDNRTGPGGNG